MDYTQEQLDQKYNSLPQDLKDAISSVEIGDLVAKIGEEEELLLDQSADLMDETALVMLGITPSDRFVKKLATRLGIDEKKASMISTKINDKIFNNIRSSLQKIQFDQQETPKPASQSPISTPKSIPLSSPPPPSSNILNLSNDKLEKAGGFTIEKRPPSNSPQYNDSLLTKEDVLKEVEEIDKKAGIPDGVSFVDHLLSSPVSSEQETIVTPPAPPIKAVPPAPPAPISPPPTQKYTVDPYREQL